MERGRGRGWGERTRKRMGREKEGGRAGGRNPPIKGLSQRSFQASLL